jgi:hypothetical protein
MPEHAKFAPSTQVDLEHHLRGRRVRGELDYRCHAARTFTGGRRVHLFAQEFLAELLNQLICLHRSLFTPPD